MEIKPYLRNNPIHKAVLIITLIRPVGHLLPEGEGSGKLDNYKLHVDLFNTLCGGDDINLLRWKLNPYLRNNAIHKAVLIITLIRPVGHLLPEGEGSGKQDNYKLDVDLFSTLPKNRPV